MLLPLIIGGAAVLLGAGQGKADEAASNMKRGSTIQRFTQGVRTRMKATPHKQWKETADHVLIRPKERQLNRYLHTALNLPDWIDLGLENRTRFEVFDHSFRKGEFGTDVQIPLRSRIRFGLNGGPFQFLFEGQDSRTHLNDAGDFANNTVVNRTDLLQLFVSLTFRNVMGTGLRTDLHIGRLTMDFGKRRYIARNDFRNTTNAFDGVHWQIGKEKAWRVRAFLVEPVLRNEERLDEQNKKTVFWGTYVESEHMPWLNMNAYYFGLNDQRSANINKRRTFNTYGVRLYTPPKKGMMDYEFEGAIQTGQRGKKDHFAYNPNVEVGYTFNLPWTPRVLVQYDYASGTRTPNGSQDQTFDKLFGARRFELAPTGVFGPFNRSNVSSPGWRVMAQPARGWKISFKHRVWYLAQARDQFVGSGLQDATGRSGNFLGHDIELRAQWKINANLSFDSGYDHWFKGSYFDRLPASAGLPAGGNKDTDYFYFLTKLRF